jgi:hypothetical protein
MAEIDHYPLLFTFRDVISGNGFLAGITLSGRALMLKEDDNKWWMYGVRPGAIAETGETIQEALLRFRNKYREVLFDIAGERNTFEAFRQEVERFFYEPDTEEEQRWESAATAIRFDDVTVPPALDRLPRQEPESRPSQITVERLDGANKRFMPSDNVPDRFVLPVAA